MIKKFENFKDDEKRQEILFDDLIEYTKPDSSIRIYNFIEDVWKNGNIVEFQCNNCVDDDHHIMQFMYSNKTHKGVIRGFGFGYDEYLEQVSISINLKRIKYKHEINTKTPFIIYGDLPDNIQKIVDDVKIQHDAKKFKL